MAKWKIYTPEGVQDILFEECYLKRNLEDKMRNLFRKCGYYEVETPTIEFYDTFAAEPDLTPQEMMFKFFDQQGRILVLRPDATVPIARIMATKYKEVQYPLRFSYITNMFRYNEFGGGKQKEFTQAGVEILGACTPESDAEVIATAIRAVKECGLDNFQIDIGQVDFFKGLMEETGLSEQDAEQIRILIDRKDFLSIEEFVENRGITGSLKELILELPKLFGSAEIIDRAERITTNERSLSSLKNLRSVLEILYDYDLGKFVSIDLGMVQSLNYYTGIIFRGFTYGLGFPILSGGRYDNLVGSFGRSCPATGFSLGINMVMTALERQKAEVEKPYIESIVYYEKEGRKLAFNLCEELRNQGMIIELYIGDDGIEKCKEYAIYKGIGGIIHIKNNEDIELLNLKTGEIKGTSIKELLEGN